MPNMQGSSQQSPIGGKLETKGCSPHKSVKFRISQSHTLPAMCILAAVFFLSGCSKTAAPAAAAGGGGGGGMPPMPVTTGVATLESAPLEVDVVGAVDASAKVEIKSQIAGQIESVHFT